MVTRRGQAKGFLTSPGFNRDGTDTEWGSFQPHPNPTRQPFFQARASGPPCKPLPPPMPPTYAHTHTRYTHLQDIQAQMTYPGPQVRRIMANRTLSLKTLRVFKPKKYPISPAEHPAEVRFQGPGGTLRVTANHTPRLPNPKNETLIKNPKPIYHYIPPAGHPGAGALPGPRGRRGGGGQRRRHRDGGRKRGRR